MLLIGYHLYHILKIQSGFRFILEEWRPTTVRQRLEDPSSLTGLHLSISDYPLRDSLLNTLLFKGCYRLFKWAMGAGLFVSTGQGGGESLCLTSLLRSTQKYLHPGMFTC